MFCLTFSWLFYLLQLIDQKWVSGTVRPPNGTEWFHVGTANMGMWILMNAIDRGIWPTL
jgi:hypothetical protein